MSDQSYITPTKERPVVSQTAGEASFPEIQGERYKFVEVIGSGGSGTVFKAQDTVLNKPVAIKKLHASSNDDMAIRFQREARLIAALKHKNVMSAMDFGLTAKNEPYLILDYVDGENLSAVIRRDGPIPVEQSISLFIQLCRGLAHAHKNGVIHRDIKPSNVMLVQEADLQSSAVEIVAKVVDFGLAKAEEESQFLTRTNATLGTPIYMSPEQTRCADTDRRSDIYSFGVLMFETMTGEPPFVGDTQVELAAQHLHEQPPTLEGFGIESSAELENIIAKCLQKNPNDRFQTFELLQASLQQELDSIRSKHTEKNLLDTQNSADEIVSAKGVHKSTVLLVGFCLIAIIVIGGLSWFLLFRSEGETTHKIKHSSEISDALSNSGKVLPGGAELGDGSSQVGSDGSWIFIDASDKDVRKLIKSKQVVRILDVSETQLKKKTFELMAKRNTIEKLAYTSLPIDSECMQNISTVKSLIEVSIGSTNQIDFKSLAYLRELPKFTNLEITDAALNDEAFTQIARLPSLKYLDLSRCTGVTASGLAKIAASSQRRDLKLSYSDIDDDGVKAIRSSKIVSLWLSNCPKVTTKCLDSLAKMKELRILAMRDNEQLKVKEVSVFHTKNDRVQVLYGKSDPAKKRVELHLDI